MIPFDEFEPAHQHVGECRRCHRALKDSVSLGYSIGPRCRELLGIPPPRTVRRLKPQGPRTSRRKIERVPGQVDVLEDGDEPGEVLEP